MNLPSEFLRSVIKFGQHLEKFPAEIKKRNHFMTDGPFLVNGFVCKVLKWYTKQVGFFYCLRVATSNKGKFTQVITTYWMPSWRRPKAVIRCCVQYTKITMAAFFCVITRCVLAMSQDNDDVIERLESAQQISLEENCTIAGCTLYRSSAGRVIVNMPRRCGIPSLRRHYRRCIDHTEFT